VLFLRDADGNPAGSTVCCEPRNLFARSGITFARIPSAQVWSSVGKNGHLATDFSTTNNVTVRWRLTQSSERGRERHRREGRRPSERERTSQNASPTFVSIRLPAVASREGECLFVVKNSFQKKAHAIEVDDGVADVELVHAEDAGDSAAALLQCKPRKRSRAKFPKRHFEIADL
jgi:hypothetical protein